MHVDRMLGPAAPEYGWVPAPRYLMRRHRILALTRDLPPGELLEVGCGAGMLLHEFARQGFKCTALESSAAALVVAEALAQEAGLAIAFYDRPQDNWRANFRTLMTFEVLEHIEDDRAALALWREWLQPGGHLVLSVPSHMKRWTAGDDWAGHYRRYERAGLIRLLGQSGLVVERFECYGYPMANIGEKLAARGYARRILWTTEAQLDRRAGTDRSGIERGAHVRVYPLLRSPVGRLAITACLGLQRLFLSTDMGSGYVLRARRR